MIELLEKPAGAMSPPEPMQLGAAIEVMKIIAPHAGVLRDAEGGVSLIRILTDEFKQTNTEENILRLLSLFYAKSLDEIVELLQEATGEEVAVMLAEALAVNSMPDLINAGYALGIVEVGWKDASRTD